MNNTTAAAGECLNATKHAADTGTSAVTCASTCTGSGAGTSSCSSQKLTDMLSRSPSSGTSDTNTLPSFFSLVHCHGASSSPTQTTTVGDNNTNDATITSPHTTTNGVTITASDGTNELWQLCHVVSPERERQVYYYLIVVMDSATLAVKVDNSLPY